MLDNTAKIGEIITALENMQGLNQKADLKSALIAKGINALDTDGVANLIAKLNSANLVLNGKKFITGKIYVSEVRSYCGKPSDNPSSMNYITNRTFNKQISCPFEVGVFAVDLDEFTATSSSNKVHLNIAKDFLISGFPQYDISGYHSWRDYFHFYSSGTKIDGYTINLEWNNLTIPLYDISDRLRSSLNWIAIEK
ncbi:hypothetical protein [Clostridium botulinum]|uniref:Uncharacterized protein n=1 Tax=Clostridium botulinum (strain Langeland / NCTC 10281 / Type F) TaxID=441772 RepID=A7GED2_CLOBL|nr:hypothetical protein [Clostridium botulinum]ABS41527.1 hypothetical protein CLI_1884 [Clostridium botulinum F str. Langeland]ADF99560.1 hypothetical protein CBF_1865 [Clostridium botulinum F str. 230613]KKM42861.1 hypothetical protein VT72_04265 [Clostridium botulinum]MBY6791619.1 hypothetical protein [Clostridium botulinum]MBY6936854.1 hypothetical protein [Clostridium botulinum]